MYRVCFVPPTAACWMKTFVGSSTDNICGGECDGQSVRLPPQIGGLIDVSSSPHTAARPRALCPLRNQLEFLEGNMAVVIRS